MTIRHPLAISGILLLASQSVASASEILKTFRDCPVCPQMITLPSGHFDMSSPVTEDGRRDDGDPQHRVNITRFALGKTEVTRRQFAEFVKETRYETGDRCWTVDGGKYAERKGRNWRDPGYLQDDKHPVTCINWNDASAYTEWISHKTGKQYRLPTEAEWEYAARGRTSSARYWGNNPDDACHYANTADQTAKAKIAVTGSWKVHNCTDGYAYTAPTASFKANAYGLSDMLGNVWEWVADSYHDDYIGAPVDGSAWQGAGKKRVLRGGSWYDAPRYVRAAGRDSALPAIRYNNIGFRLARSIP